MDGMTDHARGYLLSEVGVFFVLVANGFEFADHPIFNTRVTESLRSQFSQGGIVILEERRDDATFFHLFCDVVDKVDVVFSNLLISKPHIVVKGSRRQRL